MSDEAPIVSNGREKVKAGRPEVIRGFEQDEHEQRCRHQFSDGGISVRCVKLNGHDDIDSPNNHHGPSHYGWTALSNAYVEWWYFDDDTDA